jgi:hypothetical protein
MSAYDPNGNLIGGVSSSTVHDGAVTINAADGGPFTAGDVMLTLNVDATNPIKFKHGTVVDRLEIQLSNTGSSASCVFQAENETLLLNLRGNSSIVQTNWNPQSSNNYDLGVTATRWRDCYVGDLYATNSITSVDAHFGDGLGTATVQIDGADIAVVSDERIKTAIINENAGMDVLKNFSIKSFRYRNQVNPTKRYIGLIAQDLKAALSGNGVSTDKIIHERRTTNVTRHDNEGIPFQETVETNMGVDLMGLLCISINAIKQLEARVATLEAA